MSDQNFFTKLDNPKKIEILDFLIHNGTEIAVKLRNEYYKSKILSKKDLKTFSVFKFSLINFGTESVMCSFEVRDEKYFFKSALTCSDSEYKLDVPEDIFQLQRRNDFRVKIPIGAVYKCEVKRINNSKENFKVELRDISLGGCLISFPASLMKITDNDEIDLSLYLNQFENDRIICIAKHIKKVENTGTVMIGLRFTETSAAFMTELQGLLVYLDRIHRGKGYE